MLMNTKNITRDLLLLDLYHKDIIFYFSPTSVFLSAISSSVLLNLLLNDKIDIEDDRLIIKDTTSTRSYNKRMIDYLIENDISSLKQAAQQIFLDNEFSYELYELAVKELDDDNLIKIEVKKQFLFNRNTISLVNQDSVREAYLKLFNTLFNENQSQEIIALALIIDTFFSVDDYFDDEDHATIKEELERLKKSENELYKNIIVFKEVIDEFYNLIVQRSTNYFGI